MSSRFNSNIHQRDARSALFSPYDQRKASPSPHSRPTSRPSSGAGYGFPGAANAGPAFSAYPGGANPPSQSSYRSATPNARGQYSDAVLSELESQNEEQLDGMSAKVKMLKDVSTTQVFMSPRSWDMMDTFFVRCGGELMLGLMQITLAIGDEIRDSTALAEKMNDSFDSTRTRLRGTMNRMLRMAERTGVGWKVWLAFFAAVIFLFWYVWLF
ncbi:hypothetical protein GTA08_BOTSDO00795 [Botryosphaeria dothidea]|uniref:Uncharacterized protein n=1 Tax=Botryosphaeria dothidea TaxID=55169 RepID=A0A8H4NGG9_9PEZI|nr:hypothetical protein GTA08_BOTSDO00795 [Botryosphaeria dothidea]